MKVVNNNFNVKSDISASMTFKVQKNNLMKALRNLEDVIDDLPEAYWDMIVSVIGPDLYEELIDAISKLSNAEFTSDL